MGRERFKNAPFHSILCATACLLVPLNAHPATNSEPIARAMSSIVAAAPRAESDPTRPVYHFHAPANWMNDPNGPIFHRGYYHLFYQLNPYGDKWGHMHWGHARSRDLVHWEHLPIALWPSEEAGEEHVFSGCALINGNGQPMIIYTSISRGKSAGEHAEQWAAIGDDDLLTWQKHPANPVLSEKLHGEVKMYDWRDPFVFREAGRTFLVLGGNLNRGKGGQAIVNLYEAENAELTRWKYLGVLFTHPDPKVANIECPNFFKLGDRWVLVVSPHREVEYFVGDFDVAARKFTSQYRGLIDQSAQYYAPNCLLDPKGRRIMWGWVRGFKDGLGWNGCFTVPRIVSLDAGGTLRQEPLPELKKLRNKHFRKSDVRLNDSNFVPAISGDTLELLAVFEPRDGKEFGLRLRRSADGGRAINIAYDGGQLDVAGVKAPFKLLEGERALKLRVFLDKSLLEVFANDRACFTRVIDSQEADSGIELFAKGGEVRVRSFDCWHMGAIW